MYFLKYISGILEKIPFLTFHGIWEECFSSVMPSAVFDSLQDRLFFQKESGPVHGGDAFQAVGDAQLLIFYLSHGVVGKHVQSLQISQPSDEPAQPVQTGFVVGDGGN